MLGFPTFLDGRPDQITGSPQGLTDANTKVPQADADKDQSSDETYDDPDRRETADGTELANRGLEKREERTEQNPSRSVRRYKQVLVNSRFTQSNVLIRLG